MGSQLALLFVLALWGCGPAYAPPERRPSPPPLPERAEPELAPDEVPRLPPLDLPPGPEDDPRPLTGHGEGDCRRFASDLSLAPGERVLRTGLCMIEQRVIVVGACWDYANAIFERAGFPNRGGRRQTVFRGNKKGPYAKAGLIQPGDWVYHINLQYRRVPHSAIFVEWIDRERRQARMLSYAGGRRRQPARLAPYDLSKVYRVVRASQSTVSSK